MDDAGRHDVLVFDEIEEDAGHDSLVINDESVYGYIRDFEIEDSRQVPMAHVIFECINQSWFARLADDLSNLPPWTTIAQAASFCIIDLSLPHTVIQTIIDTVGPNHFYRGNWVELTLNRDVGEGDTRVCLPVDIYLPPDGELNPANTGINPNHAEGWFLRTIAPVPDTDWGLRKLQRLCLA